MDFVILTDKSKKVIGAAYTGTSPDGLLEIGIVPRSGQELCVICSKADTSVGIDLEADLRRVAKVGNNFLYLKK
jgi:hypothetical protein